MLVSVPRCSAPSLTLKIPITTKTASWPLPTGVDSCTSTPSWSSREFHHFLGELSLNSLAGLTQSSPVLVQTPASVAAITVSNPSRSDKQVEPSRLPEALSTSSFIALARYIWQPAILQSGDIGSLSTSAAQLGNVLRYLIKSLEVVLCGS